MRDEFAHKVTVIIDERDKVELARRYYLGEPLDKGPQTSVSEVTNRVCAH